MARTFGWAEAEVMDAGDDLPLLRPHTTDDTSGSTKRSVALSTTRGSGAHWIGLDLRGAAATRGASRASSSHRETAPQGAGAAFSRTRSRRYPQATEPAALPRALTLLGASPSDVHD